MEVKSIFEKSTFEEISSRIDKLSIDSNRVWGKMDVDQMVHHCYVGLQMASGEVVLKRNFIGLLIGPMIKRQFLKGKPFQRNSPTGKELLVKEKYDLEVEKKRLKEKLQIFHSNGEAGASKVPHAFFGNMSSREWGQTQYMHLDHHLRQFSN